MKIKDCSPQEIIDNVRLASMLLGIHKNVTDAEIMVIDDFLKRHFAHYQVSELAIAVSNRAAGRIGNKLEHYGTLSASFFGNLLSENREYQAKRNILNGRTNALQLQQRTARSKKEDNEQHFKNVEAYILENKKLPHIANWKVVGLHIIRRDKISFTDEEIEKLRQKAERFLVKEHNEQALKQGPFAKVIRSIEPESWDIYKQFIKDYYGISN